MYGYFSSTAMDTNGPTTAWTGDNSNRSYRMRVACQDYTVIVINHPADTGRQRIQEALEDLNIDKITIDRALAAHDAHLDMEDWLRWRVPERQRPLPRGRMVPCAAQRRCPARNPLARVSRAPIVAYRADAC